MNKYKLSPTFQYQIIDNQIILGKGTKQKILDISYLVEIVNIGSFLSNKLANKKEIIAYINNQKLKMIDWNFLWNNDFLIDSEFNLDSTFSRNEMFWNYKFNNIDFIKKHENLNFIIWGCGGIGNAISFSLASMGFKNFTLIDMDVIEKTNLNRQFLFENADIGNYKNKILAKKLLARFGNLNFKFSLEDVGSNSFIILSADEGNCILDATKFSFLNKAPLLNVGYLNDISVIGPFSLPGNSKVDSSCLNCNYKITNDLKTSKFLINKAPSWIGNNFLSNLIAIKEIINYLNNDFENLESINKRFGVELFSLQSFTISMKRDPKCKFHYKF
ncbi:ThiF family adenylyltransferase [Williamsoniiplasma lucivorax]|uniref:MccB-like protein n=1 Tax=Williamsoniiplasma lucivorax TaxID=209274 RepID=A0A2S5REP5_9MOLU|nr:ThiF family adenylyltransferase [Williamsoniiplasma lucivorax]PPE05796.1 MccB-like protein [Williamsoniiplasma lucivorax]